MSITNPVNEATALPLERWQQLCLAAADVIRDAGWCQGFLERDDGMHCLVGALLVADGQQLDKLFEPSADATKALSHIHAVVGSPMNWNDEDGRTGEEVVALLVTTALSESPNK